MPSTNLIIDLNDHPDMRVSKPKQKLDEILNAYCPTGEGGGLDNSCSPFNTHEDEKEPQKEKTFVGSGTGTRKDPIQCGQSVRMAKKMLAKGHYVHLNGKKYVGKLLDEVAASVTNQRGEAMKITDLARAIDVINNHTVNSFFSECERNDKGWCEPKEGGNSTIATPPSVGLSDRMQFQGKISKPKLVLLKAAFAEASATVESNLGSNALELLQTQLGEVKVYDGPVKIVNDLRKYGISGKAMGYYNRATKALGIVAQGMKFKSGEFKWDVHDGILAHELSHAIDGPHHRFSGSKEFDAVWKSLPRDKMSEEGKRSKSEAFADVMREFLAPRPTKYSFETYKHEPLAPPSERFPEAHAYFKKEGLVK